MFLSTPAAGKSSRTTPSRSRSPRTAEACVRSSASVRPASRRFFPAACHRITTNWCYFVYDPVNSPFKQLRWLRWLPRAMTSRPNVPSPPVSGGQIEPEIPGATSISTIFPSSTSPYSTFRRKKNPLQPGGLNRGPNIFDRLEEKEFRPIVSDQSSRGAGEVGAPHRGYQQRADRLRLPLYWPDLDGLLHRVGNTSPDVPAKLRSYEPQLLELM